jgi:serine/threonine protein kinase
VGSTVCLQLALVPSAARPDSSRPGRTRPGSIGSAGTRLQTRALREPQPIGAAGYAPLEQYGSNRPVGPQTDIYALGATLYHLLTGQVPVEALDRAQGERLPDPYSLNPRVSRPLSDAVMWAMGLQSAERPSTVRVFLERLSHCVGQAAPTAAPQAPEKFLSVPREAAVSQPRHSKHLGGSNNWGEYSHKTKQRLGLAALLTMTIGLAAWTLWRGSTTEPQPPQQPAQGTSQDLSSQQRPTAGPPVVAVPPKLSDKSAQGSRASNQTAGATAQLNTPQGDTPQRDTAQPNIPGAVRRNAVATVPTVVPAAPSTRRVAEGAISAPTVDSDGNTNRVESNRADVNRAVIGGENASRRQFANLRYRRLRQGTRFRRTRSAPGRHQKIVTRFHAVAPGNSRLQQSLVQSRVRRLACPHVRCCAVMFHEET